MLPEKWDYCIGQQNCNCYIVFVELATYFEEDENWPVFIAENGNVVRADFSGFAHKKVKEVAILFSNGKKQILLI